MWAIDYDSAPHRHCCDVRWNPPDNTVVPSRWQAAQAPWYIVPADDKKNSRVIISQIILDTLADLKMAYPTTTPERHHELESFLSQL